MASLLLLHGLWLNQIQCEKAYLNVCISTVHTGICGCVSMWVWINQIQQWKKFTNWCTKDVSAGSVMICRKISLCGLSIKLGMSLISAFPVDIITFMFFMDINPDALLCLLVLVKKRIERQNCHIIIMSSSRLCCNNSISAILLRKIEASNGNPWNWIIWLKSTCGHKICSWCVGGSTHNKRDDLCSCVRFPSKVAKYEEKRKTAVSLFSRAIMERSQSSFRHTEMHVHTLTHAHTR